MKTHFQLTKSILFLLFILSTISLLALTEYFKNPKDKQSENLLNKVIFNFDQLEKIQSIIIQNKFGKFQFDQKIADGTLGSKNWMMTYPIQKNSNISLIENLFQDLGKTKIINKFPASKKLLTAYSLDNTLSTLELITENQQKYKIQFGLQNSIDNTLFIRFENSPWIYQTEKINTEITSLDISLFVQESVFNFKTENLVNIQIYNGVKSNDSLLFNIQKIQDDKIRWKISENEFADEQKLFGFLNSLLLLKSVKTLESINDLQRKKIVTLLNQPKLLITTEDIEKNILTYTVTNLFNEFPDFETKGESYFMLKVSNLESYFLLKKSDFEIFDIRKNIFENTLEKN